MKNIKINFYLLEKIIVVMIMIVAFLGLTHYSIMFEKSRLVKAKMAIGNMRQLGQEHYLNNNSLEDIGNNDVGVDNTCTSASFYRYWVRLAAAPGQVDFIATRCTSGGKIPNALRQYNVYLRCDFGSGQDTWYCNYPDDNSSCFGLSSG
jgi:Tfp pilus assembly protein PilE